MPEHEKPDYVEFTAVALEVTREFFSRAFGWSFEACGLEYCALGGEGLDGGFYRSPFYASTRSGSALLVFYRSDLEATLEKVEWAGGRIEKPIFAFPGGRRFHFREPSGNEFAVWSERQA